MKDLALRALDAAARARRHLRRCARHRNPRARNHHQERQDRPRLGSSESQGVGIRVLAFGCWGFAATDDLTPAGLEAAAALAARHRPLRRRARKKPTSCWRPKRSYQATWVSPCAHRSVFHSGGPQSGHAAGRGCGTAPHRRHQPGRNLDAFRAPPPGVRLHPRQPDRSDALPSSGAGFSALSYKDGEIQKRSYPNSFGGQYQLKGYELVDELDLLEQCAAHRRRGRGAAFRRPVPGRRIRPDPRQLAARPADSRIHRPSHRARPRAGQRGQLRRHELSHARPARTTCATARTSSTWSATRAWSTAPAWELSPSTTKACPRNPPISSATASSSAT